MTREHGVFCQLSSERIQPASTLAVAFDDGFPVSPGHLLVIPRRHVASFFELEAAERAAMFGLLDQCREKLLDQRAPDGFNIGLNDGPAAGQTVLRLFQSGA